MIILGIETSCDETALALIETRKNSPAGQSRGQAHGQAMECRVIQSLVHSQAALHSAFGGVYPALAKREHGKNLVPLLKKLLDQYEFTGSSAELSQNEFNDMIVPFKQDLIIQNPDLIESVLANIDFLKKIPKIDQIAVTEGPGLEPALWVGINFARILGTLWQIPVIPINHMEGHIIGSLLPSDKPFGTWQKLHTLPLPSVALLISGGHTQLVSVEKDFTYNIIGETKDDAVGEAYDKVARLLGLPYPGGPHISKLASEAREKNIDPPIKLPRPMIQSKDCNFSFSGLKTAVLYAIREENKKTNKAANLDNNFKMGLAREFEDAVEEVLEVKLRRAIESDGAEGTMQARSIIIGGGVSANHTLRSMFEKVAKEYDIPLFMPSQHISGDNALMIALAAAVNKSANIDRTSSSNILKAQGTKRL